MCWITHVHAIPTHNQSSQLCKMLLELLLVSMKHKSNKVLNHLNQNLKLATYQICFYHFSSIALADVTCSSVDEEGKLLFLFIYFFTIIPFRNPFIYLLISSVYISSFIYIYKYICKEYVYIYICIYL